MNIYSYLFQVLVDFRVRPYMSLSIIRLLMRRLIYANEQPGYLGQYSSTIQRCAKKVEKWMAKLSTAFIRFCLQVAFNSFENYRVSFKYIKSSSIIF